MKKEGEFTPAPTMEAILSHINTAFSLSNTDLQRLQEMIELRRKADIGFRGLGARLSLSFKIRQRLDELKSGAIPRVYTLLTKVEASFIHPRSEIWQGVWSTGFCIDDSSICSLLIGSLSTLDELSNSRRPFSQVLANSIQEVTSQYFGDHDPNNNNMRNKLYPSRWVSEEPVSITKLKGKSMAACSEWAGIANNLMTFCGVTSSLVLSPSCDFGDGKEPFHAYLILDNKGEKFINDPINPFYIFTPDGKIVGSVPSIYPITDQQFNGLTGRFWEIKPVDVIYASFTRNGNDYDHRGVLKLSYSGPYPPLN